MSLGFIFKESIDAKNPLDPHDSPPEGWDTDINTRDYRRALFGFVSPLFSSCCEWEERELARLAQIACNVSA